jgi:dTDP-glucose pyrophosphorylase
MILLIPMAGAGSRFKEEGYTVHKPAILTTDRNKGKVPMVVAATNDLPGANDKETKIIYIDRNFHKTDGVETTIKEFYPNSEFLTIDYLTQGQASTCLLAKDFINNNDELLIAGCDNGLVFDQSKFEKEKQDADALIFTYRNHNLVLEKPNAHGWVKVDRDNFVEGVSVKKAISDTPLNDHAIVATFWFKRGVDFVRATEKMIEENDRINNEFYVDQTMKHVLDLGLKVKVFEVEKYLCWGTPKDYEEYESTFNYWKEFFKNENAND